MSLHMSHTTFDNKNADGTLLFIHSSPTAIITSSEGSSNSIFARQQVFLRLRSTIVTAQDYAYSGLKNWGTFCIESFCCPLAL